MTKRRRKIKMPESLPLFNGIFFDAYLIDGETLEVVPTKEAKDLWFFNRSNVQCMVAEMQQIMLRDAQIRNGVKVR